MSRFFNYQIRDDEFRLILSTSTFKIPCSIFDNSLFYIVKSFIYFASASALSKGVLPVNASCSTI